MSRTSRSPRRWVWLALGSSLALHLVTAVLLVRAPRPSLELHVDLPLEIEVLTRPAPPAPEPPPAPPPPEPARPEVRRRPVPPAPVVKATPPPRPVAPEDEPPPAKDDMLHMRPEGPRLGLDWRSFAKVEPAPASSKKKGEEVGSTGARVAKMLAPSSEDNVKVGKVHPQLYDYQRDALSAFHPTESTTDAADGRPSIKGAFRQWWASYLAAIESDNGHAGQQETRAGRSDDKGAVVLACDVCVTIAFGQAPRLELAHGSSSDELDRAAVEAMRIAVDKRPVTEPLWPAGTRADSAAPMRACYRFSASARRLPPVMLPGCAFDEVKMKVGCTWPMKKIFKSDVKLVSAGPG
jgi:outer membrane biosynthesis protein TonB